MEPQTLTDKTDWKLRPQMSNQLLVVQKSLCRCVQALQALSVTTDTGIAGCRTEDFC